MKFVPHMPQAYFTFAKQIFHREAISLVPQERISLKKAKSNDLAFFLVDLKGFEPSTSRMRTERSPKADILHPCAFDSLNFYTISLKLWLVYQKNVIVEKRHGPLVLLKKIQVLIIFCKTSLQDHLLVLSNLSKRKQKYAPLRNLSQELEM